MIRDYHYTKTQTETAARHDQEHARLKALPQPPK